MHVHNVVQTNLPLYSILSVSPLVNTPTFQIAFLLLLKPYVCFPLCCLCCKGQDCHSAPVEVKGQLARVGSSFPPCRFQGVNLSFCFPFSQVISLIPTFLCLHQILHMRDYIYIYIEFFFLWISFVSLNLKISNFTHYAEMIRFHSS